MTNTAPPVGTIMRLGELRAKVFVSWPDYLVARGEHERLHTLRHLDGEWRDFEGDVWSPEVQP